MTTYIALLRGINVGGNNKIPMAGLRGAFGQGGLSTIQTYIQSGNVVFRSEEHDKNLIVQRCEDCITKTFGLNIAVFVCTAHEWLALYNTNPFLTAGLEGTFDPKQYHLTLLSTAPNTLRINSIQPENYAPDRFAIVGQNVYLHTPDGYGKTLLTNGFFEKTLAVKATTRNWHTVTELTTMINTGE